MHIAVKTPPVEQTMDAAFVRLNKRVFNTAEDSLIDLWILAAEEYIEKSTNRALMSQQFTLTVNKVLPVIHIPRPPLVSIDAIRVTKTDEAMVTPDLTGLVVGAERMLATVAIPDIDAAETGVIEIDYTAGYTAATVPASLKTAVLLLASHYLTSREAAYMDKRLMDIEKKIPYGVDDICARWRVPNVTEEYDQ